MSIQQMLLGASAVATKTYVDDVFSTYIYEGTGSAGNQVNNGIDVSGEGAMVWIKPRASGNHYMVDSERNSGAGILNPNTNSANANNGNLVSSLNSNGFTLGSLGNANTDGDSYASWTFRKAPGFFDVVTWTGNGTAGRTISHSLSSVPGMILVKRTDTAADWAVYHRSNGATKIFYLNSAGGIVTDSDPWDDTEPTSSVFTVGDHAMVNASSATYVAYVFAGGESTAATARSVEFDGSGDYLTSSTSSDFDLGTGDFTLECWIYHENAPVMVFDKRTSSDTGDFAIYIADEGTLKFFSGGDLITSSTLARNKWYHAAFVKSSGKLKLYINGAQDGATYTDNNDYDTQQCRVGASYEGSMEFNGKISNLRLVKGTAVYTSAFRPPTEPLTSISGTSLLCCNNSSVTGTTTGTVTSSGDPTASTDSPFDDPAAFTFGESGSESVIKCGSYVGNGSSTGPEINLGWEPQWVIIKNTSSTQSWLMHDSMRGWVTGGNDADFYANASNQEHNSVNYLDLTPTGFKITNSADEENENGDTFIYIAIRRPDGYVGKPPELGTDVFAMVMSNGSVYNSGFPVDFAFYRKPAATYDWWTVARLIQGKELKANTTSAGASWGGATFDSNVSWGTSVQDNTHQSWMWKRNAGFDVVTYTGTGSATTQNHSLGKVPEMIWIKHRSGGSYTWNWVVGHKGLNGGTNPWHYYLDLNTSYQEADNSNRWNDTAPTSSVFSIGDVGNVNENNSQYIAMLFASVDGISKVGNFTSPSSGNLTVTLGFQPRVVIVKCPESGGTDWHVFDSLRGFVSGDYSLLKLNTDDDEETSSSTSEIYYIQQTSTGFIFNADFWGEPNENFIYYAHA